MRNFPLDVEGEELFIYREEQNSMQTNITFKYTSFRYIYLRLLLDTALQGVILVY